MTPAPDIPPEVERQFKRLEWITYRLRRAYLEGTPSQPTRALASAGVTASSCQQCALLDKGWHQVQEA